MIYDFREIAFPLTVFDELTQKELLDLFMEMCHRPCDELGMPVAADVLDKCKVPMEVPYRVPLSPAPLVWASIKNDTHCFLKKKKKKKRKHFKALEITVLNQGFRGREEE